MACSDAAPVRRPKLGLAIFAALTTLVSCSSGLMSPAQAQHLSLNGRQRTTRVAAATSPAPKPSVNPFQGAGSGMLQAIMGKDGKPRTCPLKHTSVNATVSGYSASVTVKQVFENPFKQPIEAIYTFPLPENAAVDQMTMKIGNRTIKGTIKKREEARQMYEEARAAGYSTSLLDQERTNIFTQSVANIKPGSQIEIVIHYVDVLPYEAGSYTFAFPTVVGPRFIPGNAATGHSGSGRADDTDMVPDASKITPDVAAEGERAGHDIDIAVTIDAGVPIQSVDSKLHDVTVARNGTDKAVVHLKDKATIPNKDFVLSWQVAGDKLNSGYLTHHDGKSGYFTLMMLPPKRVTPETVSPKEMIFVIDCSGSQSGAPLAKAKETMNYIIDHMNGNDTFQIIAFSNDVRKFADKPQLVSGEMKRRARSFINSLEANGGTWMAPAVEAACTTRADANRLRIVTFMTDGYVGNDYEVLGMIKKLRGTSRWFAFGTGNSVNRTLIDGIAREGGGEAEYVLLNSKGDEVGKKFYERISSPVLTDVKLDFHDLPVKEVFPVGLSDVWAERPLYIKGRYTKPTAGTITLTGFAGGKPYRQDLKVNFPAQPGNEAIAQVWARAKVDRLRSEDWFGVQSGKPNAELKDEIVRTALDYHIMTEFTSFVAVDDSVKVGDGAPRQVPVDVEQPEGVSRENTTGKRSRSVRNSFSAQYPFSPAPLSAAGGSGGLPRPTASPMPMSRGPARRAELAAGGFLPPPAWSAPAEAQALHKAKAVEKSGAKALPPEADALREREPAKESNRLALNENKLDGKDLADRKKQEGWQSKLDPALQQILASHRMPKAHLHSELVKVQIQLKDPVDKPLLETLKKLGVKIINSSNRAIVAKVDILQLKAVCAIAQIESIRLLIN